MSRLNDSVKTIPFIGYKYEQLLSKLKIYTIKDLLYHFPSYHSDTSEIFTLSDLDANYRKTVRVIVESIKNIRTRYGKYLTEAKVYDDSGEIDVIWFNQPFLTRIIKEGSTLLLNGKINPNHNKPQLYSPTYELLINDKSIHLGRIAPIYPTTEGLTSKWLRAKLKYLLESTPEILEQLEETLPQSIIKHYKHISLKDAIIYIHFPENEEQLKKAQKRLAF